MAFFPRLIASEFAPMFRLMDDYATHVASRSSNGFSQVVSNSFRTYQPRFDVKESKDAYELHGELPGIQQKDINIEFTDPSTLSIKGCTEFVREEGTRSQAVTEAQQQPQAVTEAQQQPQLEQTTAAESETSSTSTGSTYHKASVEDESGNATMSGANPDATPASTPAASEAPAQEVAPKQQAKADASRYWVSERSVGQFARTFSFPSRVDQENVKASLKNGILSIVVPKATAPVSRRIEVE